MSEVVPETGWSPSSWRSKHAAQVGKRQAVNYPDPERLSSVLAKISALPPLVTPSEWFRSADSFQKFRFERLRFQLAAVQRNEAFLLHAGDCAESFDACTQQNISAKIGLILSFSLILIWGGRLPVVRVGRIAGQYAKPRSSATERIGDREVLSFRYVQPSSADDPDDRTPDPQRLLSAYFHSTTTLNYVRGLLTSGFASLHHPRDWSLSHVRSPSLRSEFEKITEGLSDALDFSRTIGVDSGKESVPFERGGGRGVVGEVDFYTSHEGLMLDYEQALTREFPLAESSSEKKAIIIRLHTFCGLVIVPDNLMVPTLSTSAASATRLESRLAQLVNPKKEPGRVTLITRYGAGKAKNHLPGHLQAVQASGHPVAWICDPMHGNTLTSATGLKTRHFGTIISELTSCIKIHTTCGSRLGGVSLEFTGELNEQGFSVTECLGGSMELGEEELGLRYQSFCDPRLNFEQALDVAFLVSNYFKDARRGITGENNIYAALGGKK
ncbi:DAHP synthetase [Boletus reticuloceps]|uniref:Phospho-2-dehydro-3-deoxyheptonate aldolase n=1 Tax=Boletus reticuloceps TaxID=495285 RepID=A0A8I2YEL4_9AGAM|nr:DAHP synthetase [Boletus reticuloceps]